MNARIHFSVVSRPDCRPRELITGCPNRSYGPLMPREPQAPDVGAPSGWSPAVKTSAAVTSVCVITPTGVASGTLRPATCCQLTLARQTQEPAGMQAAQSEIVHRPVRMTCAKRLATPLLTGSRHRLTNTLRRSDTSWVALLVSREDQTPEYHSGTTFHSPATSSTSVSI